MKNKKAAIIPLWVPGLVFISLIVLTTSVVYLNDKLTNLTALGESQQQVFETAVAGEKALVYADAAAALAAQQAIFDIAYDGGYGLKQGCGFYLGFNMWASSEDKCYPESQTIKSNFEDTFLNVISGYLALYTEIKLPTDYKVTEIEIGENPMMITGSAFSNIRIPIYATAERPPEIAQAPVVTQPTTYVSTAEFKPPKVTYTPSQAEIKSTIIRLAQKYNVSANIVLAVALTESGMSQTWTKDGVLQVICAGPYGSKDCGVMQINQKAHPGCYRVDAKDREICSVEECKGTTAYNTTCNIAAGIDLLKRLYKRAEGIIKTKSSYVYCKGTLRPVTYTDPWNIALRLYNGPGGCGTVLAGYVEKVRANEKGIETAIG